ncbi:MAG: ATP-grasp domain-containing protein, partial [Planctomycetes bacterium]|nr:ATP-grasp domain-containing protein [Planctomycetota bacterium]
MTAVRPLRRVLIANRGEIAVRIARSLREAGIWVIAVYSEADRDALHVRVADQAVCIGGAAASQSYLVPERLLEAAAATQACAIHPGYGFLAENAAFSETCEKAGLVFIGPTGASIRAMGDKSAARELAQEADVPVVPGHRDVSDADLERVAKEVGFPLLLKPSAGGGGKGMHRVESAARLVESARAARREARASFGDDRLIVERYVHPARHIEIQVFADGRGEVLALGERECSLQRRHQKVVEECPSPVLLDEQRQAMCADAIKLARAVDYRGAGTVEFLLGPDGRYYFLEMNTRLQVEHPVTEMVYGVDLVRAQIAVAEGRGLPEVLRQAKPRGAAIEVRLYA